MLPTQLLSHLQWWSKCRTHLSHARQCLLPRATLYAQRLQKNSARGRGGLRRAGGVEVGGRGGGDERARRGEGGRRGRRARVDRFALVRSFVAHLQARVVRRVRARRLVEGGGDDAAHARVRHLQREPNRAVLHRGGLQEVEAELREGAGEGGSMRGQRRDGRDGAGGGRRRRGEPARARERTASPRYTVAAPSWCAFRDSAPSSRNPFVRIPARARGTAARRRFEPRAGAMTKDSYERRFERDNCRPRNNSGHFFQSLRFTRPLTRASPRRRCRRRPPRTRPS